jgi:hypothetical protein
VWYRGCMYNESDTAKKEGIVQGTEYRKAVSRARKALKVRARVPVVDVQSTTLTRLWRLGASHFRLFSQDIARTSPLEEPYSEACGSL